MRPAQLRRWKERASDDAATLVAELPKTPVAIKDLYPEFKLGTHHTTALDPYIPIWAQLPFFERIIVGITPFLPTEETFHKWYGVHPHDLLALQERGRVAIRLLYPTTLNETPDYLDCFFNDPHIPATIRDNLFDEHLLGSHRTLELRRTFKKNWRRSITRSIDTFEGDPARAFTTAQNAYLQLHALGHEERATEYDTLVKRGHQDKALAWLELCRLFHIGPIHYSLLGLHSVADNATAIATAKNLPASVFPSELGRILVQATGLVKHQDVSDRFSLKDCLDVYPDYEEARRTLYALRDHVAQGDENTTITTAEQLRDIIRRERNKRAWFLRSIRFIAVTGATVAAAPLAPLTSLLIGLGLTSITELLSPQVDHTLSPVVTKARPHHLNLLLHLDDDVRTHFRTDSKPL